MRTLLVVNPMSGRGRARRLAVQVRRTLRLDSISEYVLGECSEEAIQREAYDSDRLVVIGGDGTFRLAAETASRAGVPVGFIPCGTGNALATALELHPARTLALMAGAATPKNVDLLEVDGETSIFCAGAGLDAVVLKHLSRRLSNRIGRVAYAPAVFAARREAESYHMRITVDGVQVMDGECWLCMASNIANLGGSIRMFPDARPDDGQLHLSIFTPPIPPAVSMLWMLGSSAYVRQGVKADVRVSGTEALIEADKALPVEVDGDCQPSRSRLHIKVRPQALMAYY